MCQSSQNFYYGRGNDGEFWSPDWLKGDGIAVENKRVRLWTYQDDVEGRRNSSEEEMEEPAPEKKEEDLSNASERAD